MELIDYAKLEEAARRIRLLVMRMCVKAKTGHVTSSFSCMEILVALYHGGILRFDTKDPKWESRDRLILSKGQASPGLYATLADFGFFPVTDLDDFAQVNGKFGVHLQNTVPGVEITSGSLGHGLGIAAGMALAARMDRKLFVTVVILGDGECHEGSIWESAQFAGHQRLNNLVAVVDRNGMASMEFTENEVSVEPLDNRWKSFGWRVLRVDGHSFEEIFEAFHGFRTRRYPQPLVIIADTVKGKGAPSMSDHPGWHGRSPQGDEEVDKMIRELEGGELYV